MLPLSELFFCSSAYVGPFLFYDLKDFFLKMVLKLNRCRTKKIIPPDISPKVKHVICISRYYESHDVFENVEI